MAALSTFTAGIAHELNNPINNISLTAEAFLEGYSGKFEPEADEMIQDLISQVERANDIVRNLPDFSRTQESSFSILNIGDVIQSSLRLIKNQIRIDGITLDLQIPSDLPEIKGNNRSLQQVFLNLLINAQHAMPDGGRITINASFDPQNFVKIDITRLRAGNSKGIHGTYIRTFLHDKRNRQRGGAWPFGDVFAHKESWGIY